MKNPTGGGGAELGRDPVREVRKWLIWTRRLLFRRLPEAEAQEVRERVEEEGQLTERFALMSGLSAAIATLGLLQSSSAVVIGAMLVSPLMSPIARLGFAFASLDARRAQDAARVIAIGAGIGVAVGMVLTWLSPIQNATPEIVARTAPTLLDLAVAILSGMAGGYATVHHRGETAIGVAIATALMPPLATLGYSIAVGRWDFAGGALLFFLTNLAAIAFSFALVARIRGVERPFANVELKRRYLALGVLAFLVLATPLALTMRRVASEAAASFAARQEIARVLSIDPKQVAQLTISWRDDASHIAATAITPVFVEDAQARVEAILRQRLHAPITVRLDQIVAANPRAQAQALVDAALARTDAAPQDIAPVPAVRAAARVRLVQAWPDTSAREISLLAAPNSAWTLAQYRAEEARLSGLGFGWRIKIVPPLVGRVPILFDDNAVAIGDQQRADVTAAIWALQRWGVHSVQVEGVSGRRSGITNSSRALADARARNVGALLSAAGFEVTFSQIEPSEARNLAAQGPARVRSADILPFEIQ